MTHDEVQEWLDNYIKAWETNDPDDIGALFTDHAVYSYQPWQSEDATMYGREAIVTAWQRRAIDPALWEAHYEPYLVEEGKAVATGWTRYQPIGDNPEKTFHNVYLLEFDDGRCSSFREYWVLEKS